METPGLQSSDELSLSPLRPRRLCGETTKIVVHCVELLQKTLGLEAAILYTTPIIRPQDLSLCLMYLGGAETAGHALSYGEDRHGAGIRKS